MQPITVYGIETLNRLRRLRLLRECMQPITVYGIETLIAFISLLNYL